MQSTIFESIFSYLQNHAILLLKHCAVPQKNSNRGENLIPTYRKLVYVAID